MAEKTIRHGVFTFHRPELRIVEGKEQEILVEHMAFHGETVDIPRAADVERGERLNAFWTVPEARQHYINTEQPIPAVLGGEAAAGVVTAPAEEEPEEVELADLDDDELIDWIMSTGRFDGNPKPTVGDVVGAAEDDPEFATRLLAAEKSATNDATRQGVEEGLNKIING